MKFYTHVCMYKKFYFKQTYISASISYLVLRFWYSIEYKYYLQNEHIEKQIFTSILSVPPFIGILALPLSYIIRNDNVSTARLR